MKNRFEHTALLVLMLSGAFWLGGLNVRAAVGFDLLQMGTLEFKPNIHPYVERAVFSLIAQSSVVVDVSYIVCWVAALVYLLTCRFTLRENGWLVVCAILFFTFTPVEIYTMVLDAKMWLLDHQGSNDLVEFRKLFIHRLAALSGVPMIALMSYYTAIAFAVFRPMRRTPRPTP
jgi:hypothetical protein